MPNLILLAMVAAFILGLTWLVAKAAIPFILGLIIGGFAMWMFNKEDGGP